MSIINLRLSHTVLILNLIAFSLFNAKSQCYGDYYGIWKGLNGNYVELLRSNETFSHDYQTEFIGLHSCIIGTKDYQYECNVEFRRNTVVLTAYSKKRVFEDGHNYLKEKIIFTYKVKNIDKQSIVIHPISSDMKKLFGEEEVRLFNELYLPITSVRFDSVQFSQLGLGKNMGVNMINGRMILNKGHYRKNSCSYDIYYSQLDSIRLAKLRNFIIQSGLLSASNCDLYENCICCSPAKISIYFNGRLIRYNRSDYNQNKSILYLHNYILSLMEDSKWKWVKKIRNSRTYG